MNKKEEKTTDFIHKMFKNTPYLKWLKDENGKVYCLQVNCGKCIDGRTGNNKKMKLIGQVGIKNYKFICNKCKNTVTIRFGY